jgi:hypothetical protein
METFSLRQHPQTIQLPIELNCTISREGKALSVAFQLIDQHSQVLLPYKKKGERLNQLWEQTCFEFFFAKPGGSNYWEVNLSPSTAWNVFSFVDNRRGMATEERLQHLPIKTHSDKTTGTFSLATTLPLDNLYLNDSPLQLGVAAVIQTKNNKQTHWALFHANNHPDFHDRASFVLEI